MEPPRFEDLALSTDATLDLLALALAAASRPVDAARALATLDELGERSPAHYRTPRDATGRGARRLARLGTLQAPPATPSSTTGPRTRCSTGCSSAGAASRSWWSTVYIEAARRADVALAGVGLPGHYVVAHFGAAEPLLLDPFSGGTLHCARRPLRLIRPWTPHQTAMRIFNNLGPAFRRRGDLTGALVPPNCDSRFPPTPASRPASTRNSPRFAHYWTNAVASLSSSVLASRSAIARRRRSMEDRPRRRRSRPAMTTRPLALIGVADIAQTSRGNVHTTVARSGRLGRSRNVGHVLGWFLRRDQAEPLPKGSAQRVRLPQSPDSWPSTIPPSLMISDVDRSTSSTEKSR